MVCCGVKRQGHHWWSTDLPGQTLQAKEGSAKGFDARQLGQCASRESPQDKFDDSPVADGAIYGVPVLD
eukprot:7124536-Heterocapsa_arctica.AAC.1